MKKLFGKLACLIGDHDWTSKALQGLKYDPARVSDDPVGYFREYAQLYCKRCKRVSRLS